MQNIRRWTKKHRTVITVVVVLLMLGLVGSFATWSASDVGSGDTGTEQTTDQRIAAYLSYLSDLEADSADLTYSAAQTLAQGYMDLSSLYQTKLQEITVDADAADAEAAAAAAEAARAEATDQSIAAAQKADDYYTEAFALAPEELNDAARGELKLSHAAAKEAQEDYEGALVILDEAQELWPDNTANILAAKAAMHERLGNTQDAADLYVEARELDPQNVNIAINYSFFLYSYQSPTNAVIEMTEFRDSLPEDSADLTTVNSYLSLFESLAGMDTTDEDTATDEGATDDGSTVDEGAGADDGAAADPVDNTTDDAVTDDTAE